VYCVAYIFTSKLGHRLRTLLEVCRWLFVTEDTSAKHQHFVSIMLMCSTEPQRKLQSIRGSNPRPRHTAQIQSSGRAAYSSRFPFVRYLTVIDKIKPLQTTTCRSGQERLYVRTTQFTTTIAIHEFAFTPIQNSSCRQNTTTQYHSKSAIVANERCTQGALERCAMVLDVLTEIYDITISY
jgi:hypothetical protein